MIGARPSPQARWLHGPLIDLLLGCGLAWMAVAGVHAALGADLQRWVPGGLLVLGLSFPHYGATLLRVYESPEERRRYGLFAVHASLLLAVLFVVSLHSVLLGSLVLTLYLTWSPWHYTGQNYGIVLMLLRRRGVAISPGTKRLVYISFMASFLLTVLALHGSLGDARYAPAPDGEGFYQVLRAGIPVGVASVAIVVVGVIYAVTLLGAAASLVRGASLAALAPAAVLVATQGLWFAAPVLARRFDLLSGPALAGIYSPYGFLWIAGAHAVQYLWITSYYAAASGAGGGHLRYLGKAALAGFAIWTVPAVLFAPSLLGGFTYDAGLALLIAAAVNLHHFVLDGAIWKLRDGRIARLLVRGEAAPAPAIAAAGAGGWVRRGVFAVGAACVAVSVFALAEEWGFDRAISRGDLAGARGSLERLAWVGRDSAVRRLQLGRELARGRRDAPAVKQLERSVAIQPTAEAWTVLATLHGQRRRFEEAARAWDQAAALRPEDAGFLYRSGLAWVEAGDPGRGEHRLARAAELAPERNLIAESLGRVKKSRALADGASETETQALNEAPRR